MPERPRLPVAILLTWLAVLADAVALFWLFRSKQPLPLKLGVGAAEAIGALAIVTFYLGRLREWVRCAGRVRELEREVQRLQDQLAGRSTRAPERATREAA